MINNFLRVNSFKIHIASRNNEDLDLRVTNRSGLSVALWKDGAIGNILVGVSTVTLANLINLCAAAERDAEILHCP